MAVVWRLGGRRSTPLSSGFGLGGRGQGVGGSGVPPPSLQRHQVPSLSLLCVHRGYRLGNAPLSVRVLRAPPEGGLLWHMHCRGSPRRLGARPALHVWRQPKSPTARRVAGGGGVLGRGRAGCPLHQSRPLVIPLARCPSVQGVVYVARVRACVVRASRSAGPRDCRRTASTGRRVGRRLGGGVRYMG